jgi:hypothetical protein
LLRYEMGWAEDVMMGTQWWIGSIGARAGLVAGIVLVGFGCGGDNGMPASAVGSNTPDAGATGGGMCPAAAPIADLCSAVAQGTLTPCGRDADGQPTQNGYLEIQNPDGSKTYTCATSWGESTGYYFDQPDQFMSDPRSCCGGDATPVAAPTAPQPSVGTIGALHAPRDLKPQESADPGSGLLRTDPFAIVIQGASDAATFQAAQSTWNSWAGDEQGHPAPDGTGAYYFPEALLLNYAILATRDGPPVIVIGPEVSTTSDEKSPLGHPTLGACAAGGGAPLVLMAGEFYGTTINNHSGRFGYDPSETQEALNNAQALFSCLGVPIASTIYYPPKQ